MFWLIVAIIVTGLIALLKEVWIPQFIIYLAGLDVNWSPWKSMAPEGEMYMLARGAPDGPFESILESVPDHNYNHVTNVFSHVKPDESKQEEDTYLSRIGVAYVGFNLRLMTRETKYEKYELVPASNKWALVQKDRSGPSIYFQYNMGTKVEGAETVGNFKVSAIVVFTAQIWNPVKAMFFAGSWESQTNAAVQGVLREYIGKKTIDKLREEVDEGGHGALVEMIKALDLTHFGIKIIDARFVDFDLVGDNAETSRAVRALQIAELEGNAEVKSAGLKAEAKKLLAQGVEAELSVRARYDPKGVYSIAEAIKEAKPTAISFDGGGVLATIGADKK